MEEIKTKKKLNKKPLIICLVLALVFGIVGFVDIKSNAAENYRVTVTFEKLNSDGALEYINVKVASSEYPFYVYPLNRDELTTESTNAYCYVVSQGDFKCSNSGFEDYGNPAKSLVDNNGVTWFYYRISSGLHEDNTTQKWTVVGAEEVHYLVDDNSVSTFIEDFKKGSPNVKVDYDSFTIDDDMLIPENVKYNCIVNEYTSSPEEYIYDIYDVVSWDNTSEKYRIQIDSVPVVQYHKGSIKITSDIVNLGKKNTLIKEFLGEWKTEKIFDVVGNTFEKYQNGNNADMCDEIAFDFKKECDDKYTYNRFTESSILLFGYRIRYIDIENQKVSAWVYLMPMEKEWNYKSYSMYSNGTTSNEEDANGLVNEYTNMEDIYDGVNDIVTENIYKDKYGVTNGNIDTSQATNWLYSVVDFIKTTPSMVGTVLAFLPQPVLYGMYITIFLGCIASAIAIVKALI